MQSAKDELFMIGDEPIVVPPSMVVAPPPKQTEDSVKTKKPPPSLIRRSKKQLREDLRKTGREEPLHINPPEELIRYNKKQLRELKAARQKKKKQEQVEGTGPIVMESLESSCNSVQKGHGK